MLNAFFLNEDIAARKDAAALQKEIGDMLRDNQEKALYGRVLTQQDAYGKVNFHMMELKADGRIEEGSHAEAAGIGTAGHRQNRKTVRSDCSAKPCVVAAQRRG